MACRGVERSLAHGVYPVASDDERHDGGDACATHARTYSCATRSRGGWWVFSWQCIAQMNEEG